MKTQKVRRINPEIPRFNPPKQGAGFILGTLLWFIAILIFLFVFYLTLFNKNLSYLLQKIKPQNYVIPFWFALLFIIFLFPVSLGIILIGTLIKLLEQ